MIFKNSAGKNSTISVSDLKADVTRAEVLATMDTILATNIFCPNGLTLVSKVDCKRKDSNTIDLYD
jgi:hypothetical protein